MNTSNPESIRTAVREAYGAVARQGTAAGGCCSSSACCGPNETTNAQRLGYSLQDSASVPVGADLGLGCGNPQAIAALKPGERVLDLGSGAGFDAFLAARQVGLEGFVIGVDMTPEMIERARANAAKVDLPQVEFRLGEIEHLPVADASIDVIISNCVINLSPDKGAVFREAYRVLARGGRLAISDVVATAPLPDEWMQDPSAYAGCIGGAAMVSDLERLLAGAGFAEIRVTVQEHSREVIADWTPVRGLERFVASALIEAIKTT